MSLINQALKLEQQKRQTQTGGPIPPMVSRMPHRRASDKMPMLLFGFTGMGMLLAASVTAIFYFGSEFLNPDETLAATAPSPTAAPTSPDASSPPPTADAAAEPKIEALLGTLSPDQLTTVQQMLLERETGAPAAHAASPAENSLLEATEKNALPLSERSRVQGIVDSFSVQGIRKSGRETRVFLNGKIRKIGDVVDIENRLQLIGFTETALVFRTAGGQRFEKTL